MPPSDQAVEPLSDDEIAGIRTQIDFCNAQHDHVPRRDLCPLDVHLAVRQLLATVAQREQRVEELEKSLLYAARADMSDGPCWCEPTPSAVKPGTWIHMNPCRNARRALTPKGGPDAPA